MKLKLHRPRTYMRMFRRIIWHNPLQIEPSVMKCLSKVRGAVFFDIGANIGQYSIPLSRNFSTVYAFEPNPISAKLLIEKTNRKRNIIVCQCAISDYDGETSLFLNSLMPNKSSGSADTIIENWDYRPSSAPDLDIHYTGKPGVSLKVPTIRLDSFAKSFPTDFPIDLVKIDVEGAEFKVLEGATKLLSKRAVKNIMVELHDRQMKLRLVSILSECGFDGRWVDADHYFATLDGTNRRSWL